MQMRSCRAVAVVDQKQKQKQQRELLKSFQFLKKRDTENSPIVRIQLRAYPLVSRHLDIIDIFTVSNLTAERVCSLIFGLMFCFC